MCLWLTKSVFLILLLIFSGASWGQSKSPRAPVLKSGPTQSFEKQEKVLRGQIEQPANDTRELPAFDNRGESRLGPKTDDIHKQKSEIEMNVNDTEVKSNVLLKSYIGEDPFGLEDKSDWPLYDNNYRNSLGGSQQLSGQVKSTKSITGSHTEIKVGDEEDDGGEDEELNEKVKELLLKYKTIEEIPMSILNQNSEIKDKLENLLEEAKNK